MSGEVISGEVTGQAPIPRRADRDFALLWAGQSISLLGDQCMVLALPLITVSALGASNAQAALLSFALYVPFLIFGLPAGVILERFSRRGTMITCNLAQMAAFGLITLAVAAHHLSYPLLFALVLAAGVAVVFFQVAYSAYMPCLYEAPDDLHRGNARLALSDSLSRALGPAIGGVLIGLVGAVGVAGADAASFGLAALMLTLIGSRDAPEQRGPAQRSMFKEIRIGLDFVWSHPVLQPVLLCGTAYMFFLATLEAALVLYCRQTLGLSPAVTGIVVGAAAAGYPIGNMLSRAAVRRLGVNRALVLSAALSVAGIIGMPALGSLGGIPGAIGLVFGSIVHSIGEGSYSPTSLTLRQLVTPDHLLKRVSAVQRFMLWGAVAAGGLLAAGIISVSSLSAAVWIGALGTFTCLPLLFRRDVRRNFAGAAP